MRAGRLLVVAAVAAAGCGPVRGRVSPAPDRELARLVRAGDRATFKASYRYTVSGPRGVTSAVRTSIDVVQRPPDVLRRIETVTRGPAGELAVARWAIRRGGRNYACTLYGGTGVACITTPEPPAGYGYQQLDEADELLRRGSLRAVRRGPGARIAGERARCFLARARPATPPPVTSPQPRFQPTRYRFEFCFAPDGVLLRLRRTVDEPVPAGVGGAESLLEATAVSRRVRGADLQLPGPVRAPEELVPTQPPPP